jgi:hypothetical protein
MCPYDVAMATSLVLHLRPSPTEPGVGSHT